MVLASVTLIVISIAMSAYYYDQLPDTLATHWGINGQANGYSPKLEGLLIIPAISVFIVALFMILPRIDPLRKNYASFRKYYDGTFVMLTGFFTCLQALIIFWNLGYAFSFGGMLAFAFGILFYYLGILLEKAKQNWFVGIRTPWTLSNAKVWDKTHKLGGKLFKAVGMVTFIGAFILDSILIISVALVIAAAIAAVVYSYLEFRKLK